VGPNFLSVQICNISIWYKVKFEVKIKFTVVHFFLHW